MNPDLQLIGVTCQIIVVFIFIGSFTIGILNLKAFNVSNRAMTLKNVMDEYKELIRESRFEKYQDELDLWKEKLTDSKLSPHSFYYNRLKNIEAIASFYDYVGVLVKKDIIKFDILFEVLPFPYIFWEDTEEFRDAFQAITYAEMWQNFYYLHNLYMKERSKRETPKKKEKVLKPLMADK